MESVLVTGATGLLGSSLVPFLSKGGFEIRTHGYSGGADFQTDLTDFSAAFALLETIRPSAIVNLAGLTNVDFCETQPNASYKINTRIVENIAGWILKTNAICHLVQISTDQVYDGTGPHRENGVALRNYYAFSKYAGELAASAIPSTTLRTNFFGRSRCKKRESISDWLFRSLSDGESIQVFDDALFSPLSMASLSRMIDLVLKKKPMGLFNLGSRNGMSKADFSYSFAQKLSLPIEKIARTTTDQVQFLKAYRPKDMRMDCKKFEETFQLMLPNLEVEIGLAAEDYRE